MPPLVCPSCRHVNPDQATYCYYDGANLRGGAAPSGNRLTNEFYFPSGRRCGTFDELVQGCQEEWAAARDMLKQGVFSQYFTSMGRMDLVKVCQEAVGQQDPDIGLSRLLDALPSSTRAQGPKLDLNPRRMELGKIRAGETRKLVFKVLNVGKGSLQGTLSVTEGGEWLKVQTSAASNGQIEIQTNHEQDITLLADTRGLAAGEPYAAKLRVITNGGVEEVPIRMDLAAHPYPKPPFQGAKTPREMAQKMRDHPKEAATLLESGELPKWFASNGWTYPIIGTPAKGVAGVQQFFEAMGLAKPPVVKLSQPEVRLVCRVPERPRFQVRAAATSKKYVYTHAVCDAPWLNILTPTATGPQQVAVDFEINPRALPKAKSAETTVCFTANGNQRLALPVRVEIQRPSDSIARRVIAGTMIMALALFLLRLFLVPVVDLYARPVAVRTAAASTAKKEVQPDSPAMSLSGWLELPWLGILMGQIESMPQGFFGSQPEQGADPGNFRDYFVSSFVTSVVMLTWWIGGVAGALLLLRKSGVLDAVWGLLSGLVFGVIASATFACLLLLIDLVPGTAFYLILGRETSMAHLAIWVVMAVAWWTLFGAAAGLLLKLLGPIGSPLIAPVQDFFAGLFRLCGLRGLANFCASE